MQKIHISYASSLLFIGWFVTGMAYGTSEIVSAASQNALNLVAESVLAPVSLRNEWGHLPPDNPRPPEYIQWRDLLNDAQFDNRDRWIDDPQ